MTFTPPLGCDFYWNLVTSFWANGICLFRRCPRNAGDSMFNIRQKLIVVVAPLVVCACTEAPYGDTADSASASQRLEWSAPFYLQNRLTGACIDVIGAPGTADGTRLQTYPCETSGYDAWGGPSDQYWQWNATTGRIRNNVSPNLCLDVKGTPGTANGSTLQLGTCETREYDSLGNYTDQVWYTDGSFIFNLLAGKCIDISGAPGSSNHLPVQLWTCEWSGTNPDNGSPTDQQWNVPFSVIPRTSTQTATGTGTSIGTGTGI